jgi:hypothetical protein
MIESLGHEYKHGIDAARYPERFRQTVNVNEMINETMGKSKRVREIPKELMDRYENDPGEWFADRAAKTASKQFNLFEKLRRGLK